MSLEKTELLFSRNKNEFYRNKNSSSLSSLFPKDTFSMRNTQKEFVKA